MNVLVVGSSVIDLFLSIPESHTEIRGNKIEFNLGDKIPTDIKAFSVGGNGTNISVGLTRLTIPSTFYTYLGRDILSREIEEKLTGEGVELVAKRGVSENSPLHLIFDFNNDRIIFSHYPKVDHDFDYEKPGIDFVFLNSIADNWEKAYEKVLSFSQKNNIPLIFSPGSRQLDNLNGLVYKVIKNSKIFFSNKEEAEKILKKPGLDISSLLKGMKSLGPEIISITDAANGGYAIDKENNMFHIKASEIKNPVEKTGAGDAYATGFLAGFISEQNVGVAMRWAGLNSYSVMQKIGAQKGLLTKKGLLKLLEENKDFIAEKLE